MSFTIFTTFCIKYIGVNFTTHKTINTAQEYFSGLLQTFVVMCVANKEYWSENYV